MNSNPIQNHASTAQTAGAPQADHLQRLGISAAEELRKTVRNALTGLFGNFLNQLPSALTVSAQSLSGDNDRSTFQDLARAIPASSQRWINTFIQQVDAHLIGDVNAGRIEGPAQPSAEESFVLANLELRAEELHQKMIAQLDARLERVRQTVYIPIYTKALAPAGLCRALQDTADALNWPEAQRRILFEKFDDLVVTELQHLYQSLLDALARIGTIASRAVSEAPRPPAPAIKPPETERRHWVPDAPFAPPAESLITSIDMAAALGPAATPAKPLAAIKPISATASAAVSAMAATPPATPALRIPYDPAKFDPQTRSMLESFASNDAGTVYSDGALASELLAISNKIPIPDLPPAQNWVPMQRMTLAAHFLSEAISDPLIPAELKQQHESVRFPLVKSAIADETFFTAVTHPLRGLVNELMLKSATSRVTGSAETRRIADLLQQVLVQFDLAPSFVREAMLTSKPLAEQQMKQFADMQRQQSLQRRETVLSEVRRMVTHELEQCTFSLSLPPQLSAFLHQSWGPLLMKRLLQNGGEHPIWRESLGLMEQLLNQIEARVPDQPPTPEWQPLMRTLGEALLKEGQSQERVSTALAGLETARTAPLFQL